eukprot:6204721-Pleurochrysis_carterae.AAC.4
MLFSHTAQSENGDVTSWLLEHGDDGAAVLCNSRACSVSHRSVGGSRASRAELVQRRELGREGLKDENSFIRLCLVLKAAADIA